MKTLMRCPPLAALFLAASAFHAAGAANLVSDSGFELATVCGSPCYSGAIGDGWATSQGTIAILNNAGNAGVAHLDDKFAYLGYGTSVNTLGQTLTTVPGQTYVVSYWVADTYANPLTVRFGSRTLYNGGAPALSVASPGDYMNCSFVATATSSTTTLSFTGQWTGGNGTNVDDVSVTPSDDIFYDNFDC